MKNKGGSQFIRFFKPVLEILREMGGSGNVVEVVDKAIEKLKIPEKEQGITLKNGQSRVRNQVQWARHYLMRAGYISSSKRGLWNLTDKGNSLDLDSFDPQKTFRAVLKNYYDEKKAKAKTEAFVDETDKYEIEPHDHRESLLNIIRSLSPDGFERLSQRLLRESGFQNVVVTGKSGDGGIDGIGILQINEFVSFNVLFQCKKYQGVVTPSHVRDFRGAMMGRADKGIIITTGTFTLEAKKEARRDGVPPIELVDGDALVGLFEKYELGLIPRTTYDLDNSFFDDFK